MYFKNKIFDNLMSEIDQNISDRRLIILGLFVGLFSSGIGIGGGTLLVPALISIFKFDFKRAASTSLATIIPVSFVGALSRFFLLPQTVHLKYYFMFIPMCIIGTVIGCKIVQKRKGTWFKFAFSIFLFIVSLKILKILDLPYQFYNNLGEIFKANEYVFIILFGLMIGIISTFLGIGCGLIIVPFYLIIANLDIHESIRLSLTTMFFLTLSASIINNKLKVLDINSIKSLLIPAFIGAIFGSMISVQFAEPALKLIFGVYLLLISFKFLFKDLFEYLNRTKLISSKQNKKNYY